MPIIDVGGVPVQYEEERRAMTRLSEASVEELNAAFDAVQDKIELLISNFIPSFFKGQAMQELHSPRGKALLLDAVDAAIDAVEETRKKNEAAAKPERKGP